MKSYRKTSVMVLAAAIALSATACSKAENAAPTLEAASPVLPASANKISDIKVTDTMGVTHNLSDFAGKNIVLEWTNDACPFVKKHYDADNMQNLQKDAAANDTVWLTIASSGLGANAMITAEQANALTEQRDAAPAAFILDEGAKAAKIFDAKVTPHMYVINANQELVYQGAIDDVRSTNAADVATANNYVTAALEDIRAGRAVQTAETVAYGCPIKYGDASDAGRSGPPPGAMGPRPEGPRPEGPPPASKG